MSNIVRLMFNKITPKAGYMYNISCSLVGAGKILKLHSEIAFKWYKI